MKLLQLVTFCSVFLLCACSTVSDPISKYNGMSAEAIYQQAQVNLQKRRFSRAVNALEALDAQYPFNKYAEKAQLQAIYAYYKNDDTASTAAAAERFIHLYPQSDSVAYAYYMKGLANFSPSQSFVQRYFSRDSSHNDNTMQQQAYRDFFTVVYRFPDSPYAADARQRMVFLRNQFAEHELHIARYYLKREAYVAAANRASDIVLHYQQAPQTEEALSIMARSYAKLGLDKRADNARKILLKNFPHSRFA